MKRLLLYIFVISSMLFLASCKSSPGDNKGGCPGSGGYSENVYSIQETTQSF